MSIKSGFFFNFSFGTFKEPFYWLFLFDSFRLLELYFKTCEGLDTDFASSIIILIDDVGLIWFIYLFCRTFEVEGALTLVFLIWESYLVLNSWTWTLDIIWTFFIISEVFLCSLYNVNTVENSDIYDLNNSNCLSVSFEDSSGHFESN